MGATEVRAMEVEAREVETPLVCWFRFPSPEDTGRVWESPEEHLQVLS